ncbi:MAG: hypothetical protein HN348_35935, partial [Proteobacteria bacterium]|nr:hypothetical protein [Pseudomonadota bacterium]
PLLPGKGELAATLDEPSQLVAPELPEAAPRVYHQRLSALGRREPTPTNCLAWALAELNFLGFEVDRIERQTYREVKYAEQPQRDTQTAGLWAKWLSGNPWYIREEWEDLFLPVVCRVFRSVFEARHLPAAVRDRCMDDLREAFFYSLLGSGDSSPGWAELAVRVIETQSHGPTLSIARQLDNKGWHLLANGAVRRGSWADTTRQLWPTQSLSSRSNHVFHVFQRSPDKLQNYLDLHLVLRLLSSWSEGRCTDRAGSWAVVRQNHGRAHGRMRAILTATLPPSLTETILGLNALHARTIEALKRYSWSWAWQQLAIDFAFDTSRSVTPRCQNLTPDSAPFDEMEKSALRTWVLLVVLKGRT